MNEEKDSSVAYWELAGAKNRSASTISMPDKKVCYMRTGPQNVIFKLPRLFRPIHVNLGVSGIRGIEKMKTGEKLRKTLVSLVRVFVFLVLGLNGILGQSVQWVEAIKVDPASKFEITPRSFCVTEDKFFLFPDTQAGTIRIFGKEENFLKFLRAFGPGNEAFFQPVYCFYSHSEGKLGVIDYGSRKGFIFKRDGVVGFEPIKTFECRNFGYDIKFAGDGKQIIMSGYVTDKENRPFDLYSIDIETGRIEYLLPSHEKFGLKTHEAYAEEYFIKQTLPAIGIKAFIDIQGDDLFFVWEGALRIIKLNIRSKEIARVFGQETPYYNKPIGSRFNIFYKNMDFHSILKEQKTFAYVRNIFATSRLVYVVYETGKKNEGDVSTFRLQTYTAEGVFLTDVPIPGTCGRQMWFDKESYELYAFTDGAGTGKGEFAILKYKINR